MDLNLKNLSIHETHINNQIHIFTHSFDEIKKYYNDTLNKARDSSSFTSTNDECTNIDCVIEMLSKVPSEFWKRDNLKILDPCCGNGNFHCVLYNILKDNHSNEDILENILYFNDINKNRLNNVHSIFGKDDIQLNITNQDFLSKEFCNNNNQLFDMIVANPPYAKIQDNGKRASKNHNLIKPFLEKSLELLKPNGFLVFITPDNWMSVADRNTVIEKLTELQFHYLNIHTAKKWFPKVGSSFTWYIIENCPYNSPFYVEGIYNSKVFKSKVQSMKRDCIPLLYTNYIQNILRKTIENEELPKFKVETSSDLHKYTKRDLIQVACDDTFKYKLIHTPKQTVYAKRPHKFQDGFKVFISTTDKYKLFVDACGMTQSIAFIRCKNEKEANEICKILQHPLYELLNNICRWGNFNNVRILQKFPIPNEMNYDTIYESFGITPDEQKYIQDNL